MNGPGETAGKKMKTMKKFIAKKSWLGAGVAVLLTALFTTSFTHGMLPEVASAQGLVQTTIAQILANPVRDQMVTVSGQIVQHLRDNHYVLDDGTGRIVIDGGPIWYHQLNLPIGQQVRVTGEVSLGPTWLSSPRTPEIDICAAVLADGTVITVRGPGRPPWAGGPRRTGSP